MHLGRSEIENVNNKRHEPLIQVKNFSFGYELDKEPVVKNLTMTIHQAESVLLLGPSGSGKSTLSLCFNGLYPEVVEGWSKGEILYNGNRLRDCKPVLYGNCRKRISFYA